MTRFVLLALCIATGVVFDGEASTPKPTLDGAWQIFGTATQAAVAITDTKPRTQLLFRGRKVVWLIDDKNHMGIPLNGSEFDVNIDRTKTPYRLALTFKEGGGEPEVFAYCIFQHVGDNLLLKILLPLALGSNGNKEDFERFAKNPYPRDFKPPQPDKFEIIMLLRKTKDVIPIPNGQANHAPQVKEQ